MVWLSSNVTEQVHIDKFYSFFEVHYPNGYNFPGESHNFWECLYVLDGSVCVSGDERIYNLKKGQIIFHKPLEFHKFYINNRDGAALLIFSFSLEGGLSDYLRNKVFILSDHQNSIVFSMLDYIHEKINDPGDGAINYRHYLVPFETIPTYSQMLTTYIYQLILSLPYDGSISRTSNAPDARIFSKAVNYMNSRICSQPSVPEIAAFCNTSAAGLKRIFYKYAGIGVHKYLLQLKMKTAAALLEYGYSVTETAEKLGFSSQAYFSAVFKRETGTNPSVRVKIKEKNHLTPGMKKVP